MVAKIRIFNLFGIPFFLRWLLEEWKTPRGCCRQGASSPRETLYYAACSNNRFISSRGVLISKLWWGRTRLYISTAFWTSSFTSPKLFSCVSKSHPFFTVLLILSARALCRGPPVWVILALIPRSCNSAMYSLQQYWVPRSEWWMSPAGLTWLAL